MSPHPPPAPSWPLPPAPPVVVLDTNVVLDGWLFDEPTCRPLVGQIAAGAMRWTATAAMRDELAQVLHRPMLQKWKPDREHILTTFDLLVRLADGTKPGATSSILRCRDGDDQKFVDLARAAGARWLFSRDRALLDLARRARPLGLDILTPAAWAARNAPAAGGTQGAPAAPDAG